MPLTTPLRGTQCLYDAGVAEGAPVAAGGTDSALRKFLQDSWAQAKHSKSAQERGIREIAGGVDHVGAIHQQSS